MGRIGSQPTNTSNPKPKKQPKTQKTKIHPASTRQNQPSTAKLLNIIMRH
jgi:hypothetical protein